MRPSQRSPLVADRRLLDELADEVVGFDAENPDRRRRLLEDTFDQLHGEPPSEPGRMAFTDPTPEPEVQAGIDLIRRTADQEGMLPTQLAEEAHERGFNRFLEKVHAPLEKAIGFVRGLSFLDFPRKVQVADRSRRGDWKASIQDATLRPFTAEGVLATMKFPTGHEAGQWMDARERALLDHAEELYGGVPQVEEAYNAHRLQQGMLRPLTTPIEGAKALGLGTQTTFFRPKLGWLNSLVDQGQLKEPPREEIEARLGAVQQEEDALWISFLRHSKPMRNSTVAAVRNAFLRDHDYSPDAQALLDRVDEVNRSNGVDFDMDTGWDLYFTKGLPKVTRDLDTELGTADPTIIMGLIPPKGHRVLTEAEQLAKQGLVPRLTEALNTEAKALQELSRVTPGAISGEVVKGVKLMRGIDQFIDADPELAARVAKGDLDLQAEMTMMARRNLTADGILPEDTVDQAIALAASNRTPKQLTKALTDLAKSTLGEVSDETITASVETIKNHTAPIRAFRDYLKGQELLKATPAGNLSRFQSLMESYLGSGQVADALRLEIQQHLTDLAGKNADEAIGYLNELQAGGKGMPQLQHSLRALEDVVDNRKVLRNTLKYMPPTGGNLLQTDISPPSLALKGTKVLDLVKAGYRRTGQQVDEWAARFDQDLGFLTGNRKAVRPAGFEDYTKGQLLDLRQRLGMALSGQLTEVRGDGTRRFRYQAVDSRNKVVLSKEVELAPHELEVFKKVRAWVDEVADQFTAQGARGFEQGKPLLDYFMRVYSPDEIKLLGKQRLIPDDLPVGPNIYFKHLLDRRFSDRLATEQLPDVLEALRAYAPGAA